MDGEYGLSLRLFALSPPFSSSTFVLLPCYNELKPRIFHSTEYTHHGSSARALLDVLSAPREKHPLGDDLIRGYSRSLKNNRFPAQRDHGNIALRLWLASFPQSCVFKNANICYLLICYLFVYVRS